MKQDGFFYHTDHQGSVRAITDDSGTIVNEYSYTAYGEEETAVETLPQLFRYTAREYDTDTGLYHYRARTYDPATGRFLQEDPLGFAAMHPKQGGRSQSEFDKLSHLLNPFVYNTAELNTYRYVGNNPMILTDPLGTIGWGPVYSGTKKRALALVNATKRLGSKFNDIGRSIYVRLEVRSGGQEGVQNIGGCAEAFGKGLGISSGGGPKMFKPAPGVEAGCYFAGKVVNSISKFFGG